ncbi:MAG TPA: lysophospholipid acyltransferase family protein, partial [Candidatus Dormibacteraeota bacterium]
MARALTVLDAEPASAPAPGLAVDDFGFDPAFTESTLPFFEWLYRRYWRVEVEGVENVPAAGRALLVANHAGVVPWDGAMIRTGIWLEHERPRHARMQVANWAFAVPALSQFLLKTGNVLGHPDNAETLLNRDQLVGVFPEGIKGAAKEYAQRYRIRRFGRGGFVQVAIRTQAPIIPIAVVGGEEVHPVLHDFAGLGRALGTGALPVTLTFPWLGPLGLVPLPSKWFMAFGEPIPTRGLAPEAVEDQALVLELAEEVRSWIQGRVDELRS